MSRAVSPSTNRPYGVKRVTDEWGVARSTYYDHRAGDVQERPAPKKRGPKTEFTDAELAAEIRKVLVGSPFLGEGHRKAWARLRHEKGIRTSKERVLRLMREGNLLAQPRGKRVLGPRAHDGTITTDRPDVMWGTDATGTFTLTQGLVTVFFAVDHCTGECVGIHAAKRGTRFEALEPLRQGVRSSFGDFRQNVARGLQIRHDHGSQYMSDHFQAELRFLGMESSPSFVRAPEGNGVAERFARTLKEQLLWIHTFADAEELRLALHAWVKTYNEGWLVARHGYRTPAQVRRDLSAAPTEVAA